MEYSTEVRVKDTDERYTPSWLLDLVREALGAIAYDPCTTPDNPVCAVNFSALPRENGLETNWLKRARGGYSWVNSPFSVGNLLQWSKKCSFEAKWGAEIVQLTPADPSTAWFDVCSSYAALALALKRRPEYGKPGEAFGATAKQPAMLWYAGPRAKLFARAMELHAHVWAPGWRP